MGQIKYVDTDGNKSRLLPKGYFGMDDYPAGGDVGRVYVGTGTENIPLAKKSEVDLKADKSTTYTKDEVDEAIDEVEGRLDIAETKIAQRSEKLTSNITVNVGPNETYKTINQALEYLSGFYPMYKKSGVTATINLKAGFVMAEQVLISGGLDLSWIDILSDDEVVTIDKNAITETLVPIDGARPAFGARDNSKLPRIGCKFEYSDNINSWDGVAVFWGSSASFLPESGIRNCRRGIQAYYNSSVYCYMDGLRSGGALAAGDVRGVDFRNTSGRGLDVQYGSTANLARSNFEDAGADAVYVIWNSSADLFQSSMARAGGSAVTVRDGSTVNARECNVSDAGDRAFHALHNSRINARSRNPSAMNPWVGDGAARCRGTIAILASYNSFIDCAEINVADAASRGIHASGASKICARNVIATNCGTYSIHAAEASEIDALAADVTGSEGGIVAQSGSTVNGQNVIGNNCDVGVSCLSASRVNANNSSFTNCRSIGIQAVGASSIEATSANVSNAGTNGIYATQGSTINANGANCSNAGTNGIYATQGSTINANGANCSNAGTIGVFAQAGSSINANGAIIQNQTTGPVRIRVFDASHIDAANVNTTGGTVTVVNQAVNTLTQNGIIYQ